jgi:hypothetical protein
VDRALRPDRDTALDKPRFAPRMRAPVNPNYQNLFTHAFAAPPRRESPEIGC